MGGEGEYLLLGLKWLSRDSVQAPYMKSTHMYGIVLSFLLAVFLSQPLYSNKKKWRQVVLHFDPSFCVPTFTTKNVNVRVKGRHGFRLIWFGGCSFLVRQYVRTSLEKSRKFINTKIKIGKYTG